MSVLSFPRIYFKGYMEWDPCTFNNNDWPKKFSTYNATDAALNWDALKPFGITPDNFTTTFRPWARRLQEDLEDTPPVGQRVPCEWNMFGSHSVKFVQYQNPMQALHTTIIGGDVLYNDPSRGDSLIGNKVALFGDGGSSSGGCLVDTNPTSPWSSQIYFGQFQFGDGSNTTTGQRVYRMHSRWLNPNRIYTQDPTAITSPASSIGVCFQTCMPYNQVSWPTNSNSLLINKLQSAASQPEALGIMIRFTGYVNLYFMNGILNGNSPQPRTYEELADALATAWNTWNTSGGSTADFFSNPCYSHIVGVIGVWNKGELASVPGGRCLNLAPTAPSNAAAQPLLYAGHEIKNTAPPPAPVLGPAAVNVDYSSNLISLDFSGAVPENGPAGSWPSNLTKADCGTLALGVQPPGGTFTQIATIGYAQYQQSAYEAKAGIIDIQFDSGKTSLLQNNPIAIQMQGQTALAEQTYTAETDTRGIYLDQNETGKFDITVCLKGLPTKGVKLLVAKYDPGLNLIPSNSTQYVNITNGFQVTVPVPDSNPAVVSNAAIFETDPNGAATVTIAPQNPGFPVLAFFPYPVGSPQPQPPASFNFTDDAFYTTIRVLPFDDAVPQQFCDSWNSQPTSQNAWNFVYNNILYVYDMLFSVMLEYVNLGSQTGSPKSFDNNLCNIWNLIQKDLAVEGTRAMPITRDLSEGKRRTLQLYIYLAYNNFNLGGKPLTVNSIPPGWTPCGKKASFGKTTFGKTTFGKTTKT